MKYVPYYYNVSIIKLRVLYWATESIEAHTFFKVSWEPIESLPALVVLKSFNIQKYVVGI